LGRALVSVSDKVELTVTCRLNDLEMETDLVALHSSVMVSLLTDSDGDCVNVTLLERLLDLDSECSAVGERDADNSSLSEVVGFCVSVRVALRLTLTVGVPVIRNDSVMEVSEESDGDSRDRVMEEDRVTSGEVVSLSVELIVPVVVMDLVKVFSSEGDFVKDSV
jgi:hypothetical protein